MHSTLCNYCGMSKSDITKLIGLYNQSKYGGKVVLDDLLFCLFPTFSPLLHVLKSTSLNKIHISTSKSSVSEGNFSPRWINNIVNLLLDTLSDSPVCFTMLTNNISSNPSPHVVVLFYWYLYIDNKIQRRESKGGQTETKTFQSQSKNKIG